MKICQHNASQLTKMAAMPIYMVKHFKNLLSRDNWADFDESLYEPPETQVLNIFCSNYDSGLTMTYFLARSNFAS